MHPRQCGLQRRESVGRHRAESDLTRAASSYGGGSRHPGFEPGGVPSRGRHHDGVLACDDFERDSPPPLEIRNELGLRASRQRSASPARVTWGVRVLPRRALAHSPDVPERAQPCSECAARAAIRALKGARVAPPRPTSNTPAFRPESIRRAVQPVRGAEGTSPNVTGIARCRHGVARRRVAAERFAARRGSNASRGSARASRKLPTSSDVPRVSRGSLRQKP